MSLIPKARRAVARLFGRMPTGPFAAFLESNSLRLNDARLDHLASLGLPLEGRRVLEVGAGIGLHTPFFLERRCDVLSIDARPDNVAELRRRNPAARGEVFDIEQDGALTRLGRFEVVYCYGLLYHLSDPESAVAHMAAVCDDLLLLETCVTPGDGLALNRVPEDRRSPDQAWSGTGCRPTRGWVFDALRRGMGHAYTTVTQPKHPDFDSDWTHPPAKPLHRAVFVGSRRPLDLPTLLKDLPDRQPFFTGGR